MTKGVFGGVTIMMAGSRDVAEILWWDSFQSNNDHLLAPSLVLDLLRFRENMQKRLALSASFAWLYLPL